MYRTATNTYVTLIGIFLFTGIHLDILCTCGPRREDNFCGRNDYVFLLAGVPFIAAFVWTLMNKLVFEYFLRKPNKPSKKLKSKAKHPPNDDFRISALICIIGMVVIVIAGLIATTSYSFNFTKTLNIVWIAMVGISFFIEIFIFDGAYQLAARMLKGWIRKDNKENISEQQRV